MTTLTSRLSELSADRLRGIGRGIEKESLRVLPDGHLAMTPHPRALGAALTHPHITTDFSESQLELVTGVHTSIDACLEELCEVHQVAYQELARRGELLWVSSMPCLLPADENIPIGVYGTSNVGRSKSVYRMGLSHRYGRRMQTICGIHYNWSLPGLGTDDYLGLIRNFRRHEFLLMYLFGASPAVARKFVSGRQHNLQELNSDSMYLPHATSLRMGRLGYQSDAQSTLAVSYNCLESYADSLEQALTKPYPPYEAIGVRDLGGGYNQLATTLLQIENEYYGTIRAKRTIRRGERPLHALRERGVEYVEVRLLDLNPFEMIGINRDTACIIDLLLLYCLLLDSPLDTPDEIAALKRNQQKVATRGREPGLLLERAGGEVVLQDWTLTVLNALKPLADRMDSACGGEAYQQALSSACRDARDSRALPSARILANMANTHHNSFVDFVRGRSQEAGAALGQLSLDQARQRHYQTLAAQSLQQQRDLEEAETMPFETYRRLYTSPDDLHAQSVAAVAA